MSRFAVPLFLASLSCSACIGQQISAVAPAVPAATVAITTPVASLVIATDALMLLAQYQAAMGGVDLTALQGTGTITLADNATPLPMSLVISGSSFLRVRISNSDRLAGFAAKGLLHKSYYVDGTSAIDSVGTGPASISAFQLLRTADIMSKLLSLSKDTATDTSGQTYDRLRAKQGFFVPSGGHVSSTARTAAIDYFFDPKTHYLVKSVTTLQIPGILNAIPLETSYSDYRFVGLSRVPFKISQTLNGQPDWVLSLSSVTLSTTLDSSLTAF